MSRTASAEVACGVEGGTREEDALHVCPPAGGVDHQLERVEQQHLLTQKCSHRGRKAVQGVALVASCEWLVRTAGAPGSLSSCRRSRSKDAASCAGSEELAGRSWWGEGEGVKKKKRHPTRGLQRLVLAELGALSYH